MKTVIVDYRINEIEKENLDTLGYSSLLCPKCNILYDAVNGHPDMQLHFIDKNNIIVHKDMPIEFINILKKLNLNITHSHSHLTPSYPDDIILNAVNLKDYFIHYLKNTDTSLLSLVKNKQLINVKQGYTKCSTAVINDNAIITSDVSIAKALNNINIDVLLLPAGHIKLPGLNYGFIGGTCGLLEKNILAFYGDLNYYPYGTEILNFLKKHKVEPAFLRKGELVDRGSIIRAV